MCLDSFAEERNLYPLGLFPKFDLFFWQLHLLTRRGVWVYLGGTYKGKKGTLLAQYFKNYNANNIYYSLGVIFENKSIKRFLIFDDPPLPPKGKLFFKKTLLKKWTTP